jgi:hypothetical protein
MKPTKIAHMKNTQTTHVSRAFYRRSLVPAVAAYRKLLHENCKISTDNYVRIFTEPRTKGLRSKYWYTRSSFNTGRVQDYVSMNPIITVDGVKFSVDMRRCDSVGPYGGNSYALFVNAL